ncbi:MAG: VWA domain-containing protein, partial [Anaerolineae bacterium]
MGFLAPLALALTALSLPILAFYLLKLRRTEQMVSSTFLWQQVLRDRQANAPWQKLRRNLLLLLQLLALLLLVVALARPYNQTTGRLRGNLVVLLDASASMQATDVSPTRFEAARRQAERLIADLGTNDTMTLISVGDVPHV